MSAFGWHQTRNGDRAWQMVSCTSTINHQWGSGISDPDTGILFNNHMDDFSSPDAPNYFEIEPSKSNRIAPGKRPVSSAAPVMVVKNGIPTACLGGAGGSKIISSVLQVSFDDQY